MTVTRSDSLTELESSRLLGKLLDSDSFEEWPGPSPDCDREPVRDEVRIAQGRTGLEESVIGGRGTVCDVAVAIVLTEFRFIGGTVGVAAARRMVSVIQRATAERLPLVIATASGGTRVTEGTRAFATMLAIGAAIEAHKSAGLLVFSYLRNPTLGGAFASWASLGHLLIAEPGARIGFLGPSVHEALTGTRLAREAQSAEMLLEEGIIDQIATPSECRRMISRVCRVFTSAVPERLRTAHDDAADAETPLPAGQLTAWESVVRSRDDRRPHASALLHTGWREVAMFDGDAKNPKPLRLAFVQTASGPALAIAQETGPHLARRALRAAELRLARRGVEVARQLGIPLLTFIDTPGAESSAAAERDGIAHEIALTLTAISRHPFPVVSNLIGEGTGGGAIALLPADRTLAAEHAWLAPLAPEGLTAIMHDSGENVAHAAASQGLQARALHLAGIVTDTVGEFPDASQEPAAFSRRFAARVDAALQDLSLRDTTSLLAQRRDRMLRLATLAPQTHT